jgi:prepilin-type N-terminal cleavage/methylation domain-containing protein
VAPAHLAPGRKSRAGLTLLEILISVALLAIVLSAALLAMDRESRALRSMSKASSLETRAQMLLSSLEEILTQAAGFSPETTVAATLGASGTAQVFVSSQLGFPDTGVLILDRGQASEERIQYASFNPGAISFTGLTRALQCTTNKVHVVGSSVLWSGLAAPISNQTNPPASTWDGRARELTGPVFFTGDGTGFSYRVPVDPAGGTQYFVNGQVTWGANLGSVPSINGWTALYFEPVGTITELQVGIDINHDGDRADTFDVGRIRLRTWNITDPNERAFDVALCPAMILQERCNWGGDLNGDGFADPIFLWMPTLQSLHVRLSVLTSSAGTRPTVTQCETVVFLRNATPPN